MKTQLEHEGDGRLVELCLQGNRNAFARIVERHQSMVCAIAYSACGDVGRSEDLAQDTFVAAWRKLGELQDPEKLKSWLCGIARNLSHNSLRRQQRTPTALAGEFPGETAAQEATPREEAISREEEALMWRALETLAPEYREPMVLFYREGQSVEKVAAALGLSGEAVRQRLSRGRVMLNDRVAKTVERTLFRSAPGKVFTLAVLAALPAFTVSASAATLGTTAAKGSATAKAAASMGLASMLLGPVLAFFGIYLGYKLSIDNAQTPRVRAFVTKFYRLLGAGIVLFLLLLGMLTSSGWGLHLAKSRPSFYASLVLALVAVYTIFVAVISIWSGRERKALGSEGANPNPTFWNPFYHKSKATEYRSAATLFGLPLVHVRFGGEHHDRDEPVKAWFAIGKKAYGVLFAFGAFAVAPLSVGGCGIGLVTLSGFGMGVISLAGLGIGIWSIAGTAVGFVAYGGCAVGWKWAAGGVAIARDYAVGGTAFATHANDAIAGAFIQQSASYAIATKLTGYLLVLNLGWFAALFAVFVVLRIRRVKATKAAAGKP